MENQEVAVILAGGRGERFWPKSRRKHPKQFLNLFTGSPLIINTIERISPKISLENIFLVIEKRLLPLVKKYLPNFPKENIFIEPLGRSTAAAIGLSAVFLKKRYNNPIMVVLTADHIISDIPLFLKHVEVAIKVAKESNCLVTFGLVPKKAETGYGYIQVGNFLRSFSGIEVYEAASFLEKPSLEQAQAFLNSKNYLWNSGMFVWKMEVIVKAIEEYMPFLHEGLEKIAPFIGTKREAYIIKEIYEKLPNISIDYGVMEKAKNVLVVKSDFPWIDVGSWSSLEHIYLPDENGNTILGKFLGIDTRGCIIVSEKPLVAALGISDLVIVVERDVVLVCDKNKVQQIRALVEKIDSSPTLRYYI